MVAEKECVYCAVRTEYLNKMPVNIGLTFTFTFVPLRLNNEFSDASLRVRFVEDEMRLRLFLSPSTIRFPPLIAIPPLLHSSNQAANTYYPVCIRTASYVGMWLVTQRVNYFACLIFSFLWTPVIHAKYLELWMLNVCWPELNIDGLLRSAIINIPHCPVILYALLIFLHFVCEEWT